MTFSRLFPGPESTSGGGVDRLFFTKAAEPQAFRHPLLTHLQHTLHSQLDGVGDGSVVGGGKHGFNSGSDYFYTSPHRHSHSWLGKSKHHHQQSHKSNSTAISALTLLTFLFFLNLLQNCLREQMETMNPTVMVMTAGAAREERLDKSLEQPDGSQETESFFPEERVHTNASNYHNQHRQSSSSSSSSGGERSRFQKISVASYSSSSRGHSSPKNVLFRTRV